LYTIATCLPSGEQAPSSGSRAGYQRLGPGYSVIDQSKTNADNANIEMFRSLAEHIEKALTENDEMVRMFDVKYFTISSVN